MAHSHGLSDHCVIDHFDKTVPTPPLSLKMLAMLPRMLLALPMLFLVDRKMHFTGLRGAVWRSIGIHRSTKNPNVCSI